MKKKNKGTVCRVEFRYIGTEKDFRKFLITLFHDYVTGNKTAPYDARKEKAI